MDVSRHHKLSGIITKIYFGMTLILIVSETSKSNTFLFIFKPMLIPALMALYYYTSNRKNILYFASLFFAFNSNIFFLSTSPKFMLYGMLSFMVYRLLTIILVLKLIKKIPLLSFVIACLPFLFIFSCLLTLTMNVLTTSFYPAVLNAILISALAGISLSNYIMDDSRGNSLLAISTLLSIVLVYLFIIQKYYFSHEVFQPLSALIFSASHYIYYKFLIEAEKLKEEEIIQ